MSASQSWGIAWILLGGFLSGSFALPMKRMLGWRWENTWLVYALFAMVVLPWAWAGVTVPQLGLVYRQAPVSTLAAVALFGLGWGVGATLFGLGIDRVGMALGFAVILGISASFGALLPLAILQPAQLATRQGMALLTGMATVILGIILCAHAGRLRERETSPSTETPGRSGFGWGLIICIFSGIFSAMLNFGFVFGKKLQEVTLSLGAGPAMSANSLWSLTLTAGFVANAAYCVYLLRRNRSWSLFSKPQSPTKCWLGGVLMGLLWFSGVVTYGIGASRLGPLGGSLGWPLYMAMLIITANVWGAMTGEWKGASRRSSGYAWLGMAVLVAAIYVISSQSTG